MVNEIFEDDDAHWRQEAIQRDVRDAIVRLRKLSGMPDEVTDVIRQLSSLVYCMEHDVELVPIAWRDELGTV